MGCGLEERHREENKMLTHKGTQKLKTERLVLRRFTLEDAQEMFDNWATDEKVTKYLSWNLHSSVKETKTILADWVKQYENPETYNWVIEYNGTIIGNISIHTLSNKHSRGEVGYCMGSKYWNMGIMTEAFRAVLKYLFEEVGFHRICGFHDTRNIGSGRVMQKNGMKFEGIFREHMLRKGGVYGDVAWYGIIKDDWLVQKEIAEYISLPVIFNYFIDLPKISDGEIELVCTEKRPAKPEKKHVPSYEFDIVKDSVHIGKAGLRIGYTEGLYYGGNIGYCIDEKHRGHSYAEKACRLLAPVMRAHGMKKVIITNERDNIPSKRTCEKLGEKLLRVAELPEWTELYAEGQRYQNIFEWSV